jgi:hypothetical protein
MTAKRVFNLIEKMRRAIWTGKFQWPENTPGTGEPDGG